jgi:hypothetical protein
MTWIANYPTKKAFREAIKRDPAKVQVIDPSIIGGFAGSVELAMLTRAEFTTTNHPKRSWFARVYRKRDGTIAVD